MLKSFLKNLGVFLAFSLVAVAINAWPIQYFEAAGGSFDNGWKAPEPVPHDLAVASAILLSTLLGGAILVIFGLAWTFLRAWKPFAIALGATVAVHGALFSVLSFDLGPGWLALLFVITIPVGIGAIVWGIFMSLKNNVILITLIKLIGASLISALVTLLFPFLVLGLGIYLKRKRGLPLSEVFAESPFLYNFFIVNIYPICFQVLPELLFVMDQGKREQRQWKRKKPPVHESNLDLSLLQVGDVILTGQESWSSGLPIQASNILSNSLAERYWTHAAIYAGNGRVVEAQADGRGVTNSDLETFYFKKGSRLRVLRHCYLSPEVLQEIVNYCQKKVDSGCAYDTWGVSFYALAALMPPMTSGWLEQPFAEKFFNVSDSYFCSELVAEAFLSHGYDIFRRRPWRVKPLDFAYSPLFQEIDCSYSRWAVGDVPGPSVMVA